MLKISHKNLKRNPQTWVVPDQKLIIRKIVIDIFPYFHADVFANYENKEFVFGVPFDKNEGMAYYEINSTETVKKEIPKHYPKPEPICPFHNVKMQPTKYFIFSDLKRFQYKCPICFLTGYKNR